VGQHSGLTEDERVEYQEIGEFARHDDTVYLGVTTITLPILLAALGYAWQHRDLGVPLVAGSLVLWWFWFVVGIRRNSFSDVRYERARDLERKAGLNHHLAIEREDSLQRGFKRLVRIKRVEIIGSLALAITWILILVLR
jgi:hypothetical protein